MIQITGIVQRKTAGLFMKQRNAAMGLEILSPLREAGIILLIVMIESIPKWSGIAKDLSKN